MRIMLYLFWAFYVATSALWSGPDDDDIPGVIGEIVNVDRLTGTHGTFRGFEWRKEGDVFYITSQRVGAEPYLASQEEMQQYLEYEEKARRANRQSAAMMRASLSAPVPDDYPDEALAQRDWWASYILSLNERGEEAYRQGEFLDILPRAGNLRINHPRGTVVIEDLKLSGDLILDVKRFVKEGDNHCHNFVLLPCEEMGGEGALPGSLGAWERIPEHRVAVSRNFHPYNGHNLISGDRSSSLR